MSEKSYVGDGKPLQGTYTVPGDKSISHRALIIPAALCRNVNIHNLNSGADVMATKQALETIGFSITAHDNYYGCQFQSPKIKTHTPLTLDMGNSGTSARMLMGLFSSLSGLDVTLIGDESLTKRPMGRVQGPLSLMGASIDLSSIGTLPARIKGGNLKGITYTLPVASAQIKSALLLAGLRADGPTTVIEPVQSRDHTENLLHYLGDYLGIRVVDDVRHLTIHPLSATSPSHDNTVDIHVPGDPSAAAFWCVAATLIPGSDITLQGINANPYRIAFIEVLKQMGASITVTHETIMMGERIWDLNIRYTPKLTAVTTLPDLSSSLMDEYPILAVAAAYATGTSTFQGVGELRVKESNRLDKIVDLLTRFGATVTVSGDDVMIHGQTINVTNPVYFDTHGDHRLAMSALILNRVAKGTLHYTHPECITTSFPSFDAQFVNG